MPLVRDVLCDCSVAKHVLLSQLKLMGYIGLGFAIYSGLIKVLMTFSRRDLDFIMLFIPWWLQKIRRLILVVFL